jgi:hypothetical protein
MTLYLIRHAQCLPKKAQRFSDWSLSRVGAQQAEELAGLLEPLEITNLFSSPFIRTIETAKPFAQRHGLVIRVVDALRERLLTNEAGLPSDEVWPRSWEDFSFCLPGCESSLIFSSAIILDRNSRICFHKCMETGVLPKSNRAQWRARTVSLITCSADDRVTGRIFTRHD